MKKKNVLFIFSGEFGYELLSFQGILRKYRPLYNELYVATFPGREIMYQDFATACIPFPMKIANKIVGATNKEDGFPLYNEVVDYLKEYVEVDSIVSTHKHNWLYPIDEKLDLTGEDGQYINFEVNGHLNQIIDSMVGNKPFILFHPRTVGWHLHRNLSIEKWSSLINAVKKKYPEVATMYISFDKDCDLPAEYRVLNPSVAFQVALMNRSLLSVYSHSGATFLSLFTKNDVHIIVNQEDFMNIYNRTPSIFERKKGKSSLLMIADRNIDTVSEDALIANTLEKVEKLWRMWLKENSVNL